MNAEPKRRRLDAKTRSWNVAMTASPGAIDLRIPKALVDGSVPSALKGGRMLSNGPGWTRIGDRIAHPFDGHGYVRSFRFLDDGGLELRARFVETPSYLAESAAGRLVHRGFATNISDRFWRNFGFTEPRNVANTTILRWGDRLLAGWEAGRPYALDPISLATRGEDDFGGLIEGQATLAHMRYDDTLGRLALCSVDNGRKTTFTFREISREDELVTSTTASVDGMVFTHDFAMTPSWYVLGGNPLRLKPRELAKMAVGSSTLLRSVTPNDSAPGVLHLIGRGAHKKRTIRLPGPAFVIHFANAFEADGATVVDACVFSRFDLGEEFGYTGPDGFFDPALPEARGPQKFVRITIPNDSDDATWETLTPYGVDFPRIHPDHEGLQTPAVFGATRRDTRFSDPFDSLIRVELLDRERPASLWTTPDNVFVGEPIFVPDNHTGATGNVLALLSDGLSEVTTLAIFDADDIGAGPVATVALPLLPIAFHGDWDGRSAEV